MHKIFTVLLVVLSVVATAQNIRVANVAESLEFIGSWQVERLAKEVNKIQNEDLLVKYNGSHEYPIGSGYNVAESKTFARILVSAECGFDLPGGTNYASHAVQTVAAGDVLQRTAPQAHTMIVIAVNADEVKVVHSNWAAHHRVSFQTFTKDWLKENRFLVFKPGIDKVENTEEPKREQIIVEEPDASGRGILGSWRVVVTDDIPYHRVSQGTIVSHSGPGGEIWVNENRTVSNTFSSEVSIAPDIVTAKVGFSVTASFSRTLQYRRKVGDGKFGYVDLYYKYMLKKFKIYYKPIFGSEQYKGTGQAAKWQAVEFQYRESDT